MGNWPRKEVIYHVSSIKLGYSLHSEQGFLFVFVIRLSERLYVVFTAPALSEFPPEMSEDA